MSRQMPGPTVAISTIKHLLPTYTTTTSQLSSILKYQTLCNPPPTLTTGLMNESRTT